MFTNHTNHDDSETEIPAVSSLVPRSLDLATRSVQGGGLMTTRPVSFADGLKSIGLDWEVTKRPLWRDMGPNAETGRPQMRKAEGFFETRRMDNGDMLGCVGRRYTVQQNADTAKMLDAVFDGKLAGMVQLQRGGVFDGGARVHMQARLPLELLGAFTKRDERDISDALLCFTNSHDGSSAFEVFPEVLRLVCTNGMKMRIRPELSASMKGGKWKLRHTAGIKGLQTQMTDILRATAGAYQDHTTMMNELRKKTVRASELRALIADEIILGEDTSPKKAKVQTIIDLVEGGAGVNLPGVRGTAYGVFQAVTEFANHYAPVQRGLPPHEAAARRLERILFDDVDYVARAEHVLLRR